MRLTVELSDDQRLVRFKHWFNKQPDHWMMGMQEWNVAGCDDWFFFCGDISPDAIIEEMSPTMHEAAWPKRHYIPKALTVVARTTGHDH